MTSLHSNLSWRRLRSRRRKCENPDYFPACRPTAHCGYSATSHPGGPLDELLSGPGYFTQMIRGRGVKVKEFMLNGDFGQLYGTNCPANGIRKPLDSKVFGMLHRDEDHNSKCRLALISRVLPTDLPSCSPSKSWRGAGVPGLPASLLMGSVPVRVCGRPWAARWRGKLAATNPRQGNCAAANSSCTIVITLPNPRSREVAEGGGVEPRGFTLPWFSGPVANRLAAPSVAEEAGIEPAPVSPGLRVSNPVPYRSAILPVPKRGFEPPRSSASCWHVCQLRHLGVTCVGGSGIVPNLGST